MNFLPFLGDIIKIWKVTILCIVIGMIATTVVSAKEESALDSEKVVNLAPPGTGYIIVPWTEKSLSTVNSISTKNPVADKAATYYISQGQTTNFYTYVGSGINWIALDLNWGDTSDSLALTIFSPSGVNLGTYHDSSDGSVNGRICLGVYPSSGYVDQGQWTFRVYGESVSGREDYTFNVYLY